MNNRFELPVMVSAKDLQAMGFGRGMAYRLLRGDIIPVVTVGTRRFIRQSVLLEWIEVQEKSSAGKAVISDETSPDNGGDIHECQGLLSDIRTDEIGGI